MECDVVSGGETDIRIGRVTISHYRGERWGFYRTCGVDWRCWKIGPVWVYWWPRRERA
jgi:hypothetical protein